MRTRCFRSTVLTAATLGALLATGAVVASPAAYAAQAPAAVAAAASPAAEPAAKAAAEADKPSLTVNAPASVGRGGQPVEFTETVTNPNSTAATYKLRITTSGAGPVSMNAIKVDYRDADGTWKPVTDTVSGLTVAAGATRTIQLRLTTELAAYWSNKDSTVTLGSAVLDEAGAVLAESTKEVAAKAITLQVKDAPTTAVAGGDPVEFDVTISNRSASGYTNVDKVVEADQHSTLQVQKADGGWQSITGVPGTNPTVADRVTYHLSDDRNMAPGETFTKHVRLAFTADAPLGTNYIHPWAKLDIGSGYSPFTVGPQYVQIEITSQAPTLAVQAPASIGNGGRPVEFTQTITNPGNTEATYVLEFDVSNPAARSEGRLAMDLREADGAWEPVLTTFRQQNDGFHFKGGRANVTVPAGATRTFQLRLSAPLNNDWAGLSGTVKLSSSVLEQTGQYVIAESTKDIALKALDVKVKDAPTTAVAGGDPVEFDVTVTNSSSSRYNNAHPSVMADRNSALQVQEADGSWHDVTGIPSRQSGGPVTYYLTEDQNLAADTSVTKHVRIAFTSLAPAGTTYVNPVVILGADEPNGAAYVGPQGFPVDLTDAATDATGAVGTGTVRTGTGTGAHTAVKAGLITAHDSGSDNTSGSTGTAGSSGTTRTAGGELAHTGSDGTLKAALGATSLLAGGIGAVLFARRRRTA
ncbi:LPXTG cell wall anchor domain-containing protein [Kitasatospora sp. NPDC090091]|uniref:LPXTG cell wall anchor domain-containing protein n=1 Tax=Kitasatospora sp. NPDC090091 TaxID=3364081 RepID=UPI0038275DA4